ncbi:MAG: helix-turn-helix domain-containing protein [Candidatus Competibacteraceae bacterium]|nr:helix-turn-helix domain-containing protein [Candidatus Competibacteraceae bacterium]
MEEFRGALPPPIYTPAEAARLCGWLEAEPRQIKQAQARLEQATGKRASRQTVHRIVKKKPIAGNGAGDGCVARATTRPSGPRTRAWAGSGKAMLEG